MECSKMISLIDGFKKDCKTKDASIVVKKHLLEGSSYYFDLNGDTDEFQFKIDIANSLGVHLRDIIIVGSGKLGFSIKPDKDKLEFYPYKSFDEEKKSDIDVAIVSNRLFENQLINLFEYTSHYVSKDIWKNKRDRNSLAKYVLKGWLKPDFIPRDYKISDSINFIQNKYKMKYARDINIGIYKSWYYFENYHVKNIENIQLNIDAIR